jgi:hypothetical protein
VCPGLPHSQPDSHLAVSLITPIFLYSVTSNDSLTGLGAKTGGHEYAWKPGKPTVEIWFSNSVEHKPVWPVNRPIFCHQKEKGKEFFFWEKSKTKEIWQAITQNSEASMCTKMKRIHFSSFFLTKSVVAIKNKE